MIALILFVAFGIGFALFATQNTSGISLYFGQMNMHNVPTYLAILLSVALGMLFATIFYITKSITSTFTIRKLKNQIKEQRDEIIALTKEVHTLEIENTKLSGDKEKDASDETEL